MASVFDPRQLAQWSAEKMGKTTIHQSEHCMVGLNAFEAGQEHRLHSHEGMDKVYVVLEGSGRFLLEDREEAMRAGQMLIAPSGVPHGVRNDGGERLLLLVVLSPPPSSRH